MGREDGLSVTTAQQENVIAVSQKDRLDYGCPYCGYRSGYMPVSTGGSGVWICGDCGEQCCVLAEGVKKSQISFGENNYPELQEHPRYGIPSHGTTDERPESGGEFFDSRGIGLEAVPCFVCGTEARSKEGYCCLHNIAAFVRTKEAGERVVKMFSKGAKLDYRESSPDRVQVKIGACDEHLPNLEKLNNLTEGGIITAEKVEEAIQLQ